MQSGKCSHGTCSPPGKLPTCSCGASRNVNPSASVPSKKRNRAVSSSPGQSPLTATQSPQVGAFAASRTTRHFFIFATPPQTSFIVLCLCHDLAHARTQYHARARECHPTALGHG